MMNEETEKTDQTIEDKAKAEAINELAKFAMVGHIALLTSPLYEHRDMEVVKWSYKLAELMYESRWQ